MAQALRQEPRVPVGVQSHAISMKQQHNLDKRTKHYCVDASAMIRGEPVSFQALGKLRPFQRTIPVRPGGGRVVVEICFEPIFVYIQTPKILFRRARNVRNVRQGKLWRCPCAIT